MNTQWLGDLLKQIGRIFPRVSLVLPTHRGILFGPKGGATARGPGLVLWWPAFNELVKVNVVTRSFDVSPICLPLLYTVREGNSKLVNLPEVAICSLAVQFKVVDPKKMAMNVVSVLPLIDNRLQAAVSSKWTGDITQAHGIVKKLYFQLQDEMLDKFGVYIERVDVVNLGKVVGTIALGHYMWSENTTGEISKEQKEWR